MPSACCCTGSPTIWSTCSVFFNYHRRGVRHRSKLCAPDYSKSARASVKPRVAFVYTWPPAGRGNLCSAQSLWLPIPASLCVALIHLFLARLGRSIPKNYLSSNQWSAYTSPVGAHCLHEEPGHKNSSAEEENLTLVN